MKKMYLLIIAMCFVFSAGAQIPNGGFETWANDSTPSSWNGLMSVTVLGLYNFDLSTVKKTADAHAGGFAAKVISDKTLPLVGTLLTGILSYGTNLYDILGGLQISGGIGVNIKPTKVKGYYKYANVNNDTMSIIGICYKNGDTTAYGKFSSSTAVAAYTYFEFDLTYSPSQTPDTFNIIAVSSAGNNPQTGSVLYLDDIEIESVGAGAPEIFSLEELLNVYPNPTTGQLIIDLAPNEANLINIFDLTGRLIHSAYGENAHIVMDMSAFANSAYFIEVNNSKGRHMTKIFLAK